MISEQEFWDQFQGLSSLGSSDPAAFAAGPATDGYRIARNRDGQPCLLIDSIDHHPLVAPRLQHLRVIPGARCSVMDSNGRAEEAILTVIEPVGVGQSLARFIVRLYHSLAQEAGGHPSAASIQLLLGQIADLFRKFAVAPSVTARGLWAELFLIAHAADPLQAGRAWHDDFTEKWDFAEGSMRIEVKSSGAAGDRRHHFTQAQLCPSERIDVWVASLWVVKSGGGVSIRDLLDTLHAELSASPDEVSRIEQISVAALGESAATTLDNKFDPVSAANSLMFFSASGIPKPACRLPPGLSEVRFLADLDFAVSTSPAVLRQRKDLLGCMAVPPQA
jgi:hypothetical protein